MSQNCFQGTWAALLERKDYIGTLFSHWWNKGWLEEKDQPRWWNLVGICCRAVHEGPGRLRQALSCALQPGCDNSYVQPINTSQPLFWQFCSHLDRLPHNLEVLLPFSFLLHQMDCQVGRDPRKSVIDELMDHQIITAQRVWQGFHLWHKRPWERGGRHNPVGVCLKRSKLHPDESL